MRGKLGAGYGSTHGMQLMLCFAVFALMARKCCEEERPGKVLMPRWNLGLGLIGALSQSSYEYTQTNIR